MAVIKCFSKNPKDGTTTFDKVRFYEATDDEGTGATLIATVAIDSSTADTINPGFTFFIYPTGDESKYYATKWYNSVNFIESSYSTWVQGGQDRWDTLFMNDLQDTSSAVWSSTDRSNFKKAAIEALYPDFFLNTIDTSLSIANNSTNQTYTYNVPFGIFKITEVGIGNVNKTSLLSRDFKVLKADYWKHEGKTLNLGSLSGLTDGSIIRLVGSKKYTDVGEVPERLDTLVLIHMKMNAYLRLADDYPRFLTWAKLQQGTKVSFENLRVHAREFERKFRENKAELKDSSLATLS
jgi:hypothetical protein